MEQGFDRVQLGGVAWRLALDTSNKLQTASEKTMLDLTMRQYMALEVIAGLADGRGGMLNTIADELDTTKQNAKQLVNALMEKEYIAQTRDPVDKRAVNIRATEAGCQALEREGRTRTAFLEEAYRNLSDEEMVQLVELLHKLYSFDGEAHLQL